MLQRYSKLTMHSKVVCKIKAERIEAYKEVGIMPWHHMVIEDGLVYVYIWDTRIIEAVLPESCLLQEDLTYDVIDNRLDIRCQTATGDDMGKQILVKHCYDHRESMPILFETEPLTDDERAMLNVNHY